MARPSAAHVSRALGPRALISLSAVLVVCGAPAVARAFKVATPLTDGCHEAISVAAVAQAGWPDDRVAPALSHDERLIARDLPFDLRGAKDDPWLLALSIGVRWNDLHGLEHTDLPALATLHSRPDAQDEHCLRGPRDDGAEGDRAALAACTSFIMACVDAALADSDSVDLDARVKVQVALAFQSRAEVSIQRYGFELGKALHALQDGFSHTLRSADGTRVHHVLNFVDSADDDYRESRDGHAHIDGLDLCGGSEARRERRALATVASVELLSALAAPGLDRVTRRAAAQAVVARWLRHEPGCTVDNAYCDAPELREPEPGCSIAAAPGLTTEPWSPELFGLCLCLGGLLWRRRRQRSRPCARLRAGVVAGLLVPLLLAWPGDGAAQPEVAPRTPPTALPSRFGVAAMVAGSVNEAAFAWRLGGRYRITRSVEVGLQAEHNPWLAIETLDAQPGAFNLFGSLFVDWFEAKGLTLRTSLHLGASILLFDLVGAPKGSVGPLIGGGLLGVTWTFAPGFTLLVEPAEVMLPVVQIDPIPFYYHQYRVSVGVQWNP
jgi:hypothetical protein